MTPLEILQAHRPSRWRSFTNENEILRCCGKDFGNATKKAKRGDEHLAWAEFSAHVAEVLDEAMREREVAVLSEVAEEAIEKYADKPYSPGHVIRLLLTRANQIRTEPRNEQC